MSTLAIYPAVGISVPDENGIAIPSSGLTVSLSDYYRGLLASGLILTFDPLGASAPTEAELSSGYLREVLVTDLLNREGSYDGAIVVASGHTAALDGGGGMFVWELGSATTADNGIVVGATAAGRWKRIYSGMVNAAWFGAGAGGDVTTAIGAALDYCNALLLDGIVSTIKHPGATLTIPPGSYSLASLSAPLNVLCNLEAAGVEFVVPDAYAQEVFQVGHTTSGTALATANIQLPDITKSTSATIVTGSVGYRIYNLYSSRVYAGKTFYFETGCRFGGVGQGCVHNDIFLGQMYYCKRAIVLQPGSGGWVNANRFFGGTVQQSTGFAGGVRVSGWRHIVMDGSSPGTSVVGNIFIGTSLEGNASERIIDATAAYLNTFDAIYHELGAGTNACTVSGDTITRASHGLAVGDLLTFQASVAPTGMHLAVGYYVVAVPTADTFKVSLDKGGTAVTFSSAGTSVTYILNGRFYFSSSGGLCYGNEFRNWLLPSSYKIDLVNDGQATANGDLRTPARSTARAFLPEDVPIYGAGNSSAGAASRPAFAAYGTSIDPQTQPKNWATAIGDRGLLFAESAAEVGRVYHSFGSLYWRRAADSVGYEIASCRRAPGLLSITLTCTAGATTTTTVTLTGASTNDYVTVVPVANLASGLIIAWARVSAADTVTIGFYNATGGDISLSSAQFNVMAVRRFY